MLEPHPFDSRILLTAGHDGLIILWDMLAGTRLTTFKLEVRTHSMCMCSASESEPLFRASL